MITEEFFWPWLIGAAVSTIVGASRDQRDSGLVWGLLLGPLGILVVLFLPNLRKEKETAAKMELQNATIHAQMEQLRLLRKLAGEPEPSPVITSPSSKSAAPPPRPVGPDDFIPESLQNLPPKKVRQVPSVGKPIKGMM